MSEPTPFPDQRGPAEPTTSDEEAFPIYVEQLTAMADEYLRAFFGERCPDYEPDCEACKRWKALDELTRNPFE